LTRYFAKESTSLDKTEIFVKTGKNSINVYVAKVQGQDLMKGMEQGHDG